MSRSASGSRTKASFPFSSSGSSAARQDSFGFPQEKRENPQALGRTPDVYAGELQDDGEDRKEAGRWSVLKSIFVLIVSTSLETGKSGGYAAFASHVSSIPGYQRRERRAPVLIQNSCRHLE